MSNGFQLFVELYLTDSGKHKLRSAAFSLSKKNKLSVENNPPSVIEMKQQALDQLRINYSKKLFRGSHLQTKRALVE